MIKNTCHQTVDILQCTKETVTSISMRHHVALHFWTKRTKQIQLEEHLESTNLSQSCQFLCAKAATAVARLSHCNSVRLSVYPSVCHMDGSVKNGASYDRQILTVNCLEDSSFRISKAFP